MLHVGVPSCLDGRVEMISVILHPRRATIELIQIHQVGVRHKWEPIDVAADLDAKVLRLSALGATKRDALQGMTHDSTGKWSSDECSHGDYSGDATNSDASLFIL
jgi:hypothetical protein